MPGLRYRDQTPISTSVNKKRLCLQLSPLAEQQDTQLSEIDSPIEMSLESHVPRFIAKFKATIDTSIKSNPNVFRRNILYRMSTVILKENLTLQLFLEIIILAPIYINIRSNI